MLAGFYNHLLDCSTLLCVCIRRFLSPSPSFGEFLGPISVFDICPYHIWIAWRSLGVPRSTGVRPLDLFSAQTLYSRI